jgi:hypothetical protein
MSNISHPSHYGGANNQYEAIKVIDAWGLNFNLGNVAKYISRAGKKGEALEDLEKAKQYLEFEIAKLKEKSKNGICFVVRNTTLRVDMGCFYTERLACELRERLATKHSEMKFVIEERTARK